MKITQKLSGFFPPLNNCIYYFMSSLAFCYMYFHKLFYNVTFYEENMGGIYYVLSFGALKPNQYRLFVPFIFKALKTIFPFAPDHAVFFVIILTFMFLTLIVFYNILNLYFTDKKTNSWLALVLIYPMVWHFIILNQIFEFTDFANLFFVFSGYYLILKKRNNLLLLLFAIACYSHDSTGFLIVMFLLFNIKDLFKKHTIFYTLVMAIIFIAIKKINETIFLNNPGVSFRPNYLYNIQSFGELPLNIVVRDIFLYFGGLHFAVLYFFVSGRWKNFKTQYMYITLTVIAYIIIILFIHTLFESRNFIVAIPFVTLLFLMFFTTQQNSFLKPLNSIKTPSPDG